MLRLNPLQLTPTENITQLIEQKQCFALDEVCELTIYETRKRNLDFGLSFPGFTVTSMLRGEKRVRFNDQIERSYEPGNTIIAPSWTPLSIDFPNASFEQPTQCTALTLDNTFVIKQIQYFNEAIQQESFIEQWEISNVPSLLLNNAELIRIYNKVLDLTSVVDAFREVHIQLLLKELVLCVLKLQNLNRLVDQSKTHTNNSAFSAVLHYIRQNIDQDIQVDDLLKISTMSKSAFYRNFVEEIGMAPYQLVINERLEYAQTLLLKEHLSVKETAYAAGFSSPNYFVRLFKKYKGITPKMFQKKHRTNAADSSS